MIFNIPTFFILYFFVPFCTSLNWPVIQELTLKDSTPITGYFRVNLQRQATITISHQSDVGVCFQRLFEVPAVESYKYCTIFIPLHTPPSQVPIPAPDVVPEPSRVPSQVPVPNPDSVPIPGSVPAPNPGSVPIPSPDVVPVPNPDSVPIPGSVPAPNPDIVPAPNPGRVPIPSPDVIPVPNPDSVPVPNPNSVPVPNPVSIPVPVPTPIPDSVPSPSPVPESTQPTFTTQKGQSKRSIISLQSIFNTSVVTPLDFADEDIYFGIYFLNSGKHDPETVGINFSGPYCNSSQIFNGNNCELPISKLENNKTYPVTLSYLQSVFFSIDIPERTSQLTVLAESTTTPENTAHVYLRYQGTPSNVSHDAQGQSSVTLDLPEKGTWYVRVVYDNRPGSSEFRVTAKFKQCEENGVGIICNDSVISAGVAKLDVWNIKSYKWVYYKFISTPTNPLHVSVQTQSGTPPIQLYASVDQVPTFNRSDIEGCNQPNCESTTTILLNSTTIKTNLTWYIGIVSTNDTSFGIWFSSVCAPNCNVNGKCINSGVNTGKCVCGDPYSGFDCLTDNGNGLRPQYIVLIIIASLVLAAVIIGLIAWVYMQKREKTPSYTQIPE